MPILSLLVTLIRLVPFRLRIASAQPGLSAHAVARLGTKAIEVQVGWGRI